MKDATFERKIMNWRN